jgi:hypothetical protein
LACKGISRICLHPCMRFTLCASVFASQFAFFVRMPVMLGWEPTLLQYDFILTNYIISVPVAT